MEMSYLAIFSMFLILQVDSIVLFKYVRYLFFFWVELGYHMRYSHIELQFRLHLMVQSFINM